MTNFPLRKALSTALCVAAAFLLYASAFGQRLPVKTYTIGDGLARDYINQIKQDSHGFIWFCTLEGLSRFDGYGFVNYGIADGLPNVGVKAFLETRRGDYLFGTGGGLARFEPATSRFETINTGETWAEKNITALAEDADGNVWVATSNGLSRLINDAERWRIEPVLPVLPPDEKLPFNSLGSLLVDSKNSLWIGTGASGIFRRLPDGHFEHYTEENGLSQNGIGCIFQDAAGRIWVGTGTGLTLLIDDIRPGQNVAERVFTTKDGLFHDHIQTVFEASDGRLWVGTRAGVNYLSDVKNTSGAAFGGYQDEISLPKSIIITITEDRDNNLWVGGETGGARKLPLRGFTSFFERDGLEFTSVEQVFGDTRQNHFVFGRQPDTLLPLIKRFDGRRFGDDTPDFPPKNPI